MEGAGDVLTGDGGRPGGGRRVEFANGGIRCGPIFSNMDKTLGGGFNRIPVT